MSSLPQGWTAQQLCCAEDNVPVPLCKSCATALPFRVPFHLDLLQYDTCCRIARAG